MAEERDDAQSKAILAIETFTSPTKSTKEQSQSFQVLVQIMTPLSSSSSSSSSSPSSLSFASLVVMLRDSLTSPDDLCRARGVLLMSKILENVKTLQLDETSKTVLVNFYCDRMDDTPSTEEIILGLSSLLKHHSLSSEEILQITKALFSQVETRGRLQRVRNAILALTLFLITNERTKEPLQTIEKDIVKEVVAFVDGERDPRNIVISFSIIKAIFTTFSSASEMVEEYFDIVTCYFPIQFRSRPNDPDTISPHLLKFKLVECLTCSSAFAPLVIPFFLEKIGERGIEENVKLDALVGLKSCFDLYDRSILLNHISDIWASFLNELRGGATQEVVVELESVTRGLVLRVCQQEVISVSQDGETVSDLSGAFDPLLSSLIEDMEVIFFKSSKEGEEEDNHLDVTHCASIRLLFFSLPATSRASSFLVSLTQKLIHDAIERIKMMNSFELRIFVDFLSHFVQLASLSSLSQVSEPLQLVCNKILGLIERELYPLPSANSSSLYDSAPLILKIRSLNLLFSLLPLLSIDETAKIISLLTEKYVSSTNSLLSPTPSFFPSPLSESDFLLNGLYCFVQHSNEKGVVLSSIVSPLKSAVLNYLQGVTSLSDHEISDSYFFALCKGSSVEFSGSHRGKQGIETVPSVFSTFEEFQKEKEDEKNEGEKTFSFPHSNEIYSSSTLPVVKGFSSLLLSLGGLCSCDEIFVQNLTHFIVERLLSSLQEEEKVKEKRRGFVVQEKYFYECLEVMYQRLLSSPSFSSSFMCSSPSLCAREGGEREEGFEEGGRKRKRGGEWDSVLIEIFFDLPLVFATSLVQKTEMEKMNQWWMSSFGTLFHHTPLAFQGEILSFASKLSLASLFPLPSSYKETLSSLLSPSPSSSSASLSSNEKLVEFFEQNLQEFQPFSTSSHSPFLSLLTSLFSSTNMGLSSSPEKEEKADSLFIFEIGIFSFCGMIGEGRWKEGESEEAYKVAAQLFSVLVNKFGDVFEMTGRKEGKDTPSFSLYGFSEACQKSFDAWVISFLIQKLKEDLTSSQKMKIIYSLIWVMRALLLRGANVPLDSLFLSLLDNEDSTIYLNVSSLSLDLFCSSSSVLNLEGQTKTKPFAIQKFYMTLRPQLLQLLEKNGGIEDEIEEDLMDISNSKEEKQECLLNCLCSLFQSLPLDVIFEDIVNVIPLIQKKLKCLPLSFRSLIAEALFCFLNENPDGFLSSLLPNLEALFVFLKNENLLSTRRKSVEILLVLCKSVLRGIIPIHKILPHKEKIEQALMIAVEDKKRIVRSSAAICRNYWMSLV